MNLLCAVPEDRAVLGGPGISGAQASQMNKTRKVKKERRRTAYLKASHGMGRGNRIPGDSPWRIRSVQSANLLDLASLGLE